MGKRILVHALAPPPLAPRLKYIYLHSRLVHLSCIYPEIKVAGEVDAEVPTVHDRTAIGGPDARGEFFRRFWTNMSHHTFDKMRRVQILSYFECMRNVPIRNSIISSLAEVAFAPYIINLRFLGGVRRGPWRFIVQHPGIHRDILQRSLHGP